MSSTTGSTSMVSAVENISLRDGVGTGLGLGVVAALALIGFSVYRLTSKIDLSKITDSVSSYLNSTKQSLILIEKSLLKADSRLEEVEDALKELTRMQETAMRMSHEMSEMIQSIKTRLNNAR